MLLMRCVTMTMKTGNDDAPMTKVGGARKMGEASFFPHKRKGYLIPRWEISHGVTHGDIQWQLWSNRSKVCL